MDRNFDIGVEIGGQITGSDMTNVYLATGCNVWFYVKYHLQDQIGESNRMRSHIENACRERINT